MTTTQTVLLVAQISSVGASLTGVVALAFVIRALSRLTGGQLRDAILRTTLFTLVVVLGVSSMTLYHLTEGTAHENFSELVEKFWYLLMFTAFILSSFESIAIIQLGKFYENITTKVRMLKRSKK